MEKVLRQSGTTNEELYDRLLNTIPTILDRYLIEVPQYHDKLLLNIPQQTALFHNNCMYLAYWLTKDATRGLNDATAGIVKSLHYCGSQQFLRQINNQRDQLMTILKDFGKRNYAMTIISIS